MNSRVLEAINYGIFAVGVKGNEKISANACIVNTVTQVTVSPLVVTIAVNSTSLTNELIKKHGDFSVSVLSENTTLDFIKKIGYRSGRDGFKLDDIDYFTAKNDVPVITEGAACWFICRVSQAIELSTHTLFIADVVDTSEYISARPITYQYYHESFLGHSLQIVNDENATIKKEENNMSEKKTYVCTVCGYVYDGEIPFEELPDDWTCPLCGVGKDMFKEQ